ncbi:MAG: AidA/PixA family protein [Cytophagales bacterium]|nr:AidA/PixA family protein [Cytophagales bacterium]
MEKRRSFLKKSGLLLAASSLPFSVVSMHARRVKSAAEAIEVTLYVDTARIVKPNINPFCNFGQPATILNEEFTIDANVGDTVTWLGVSSNAPLTDVVNIVMINHEGGKNVFDKNVLKGDGKTPERVTGEVKYPTTVTTKYKYKISFTVINNGVQRNGVFHIDPKMEVH